MAALNVTPVLAEITLSLIVGGLVVLGAFLKSGEASVQIMRKCAIVAIILTAGLVVAIGLEPSTAFGGAFIASAFTVYMKLLVLLGALAVIVMAQPSLIKAAEFPMLVLFAVLGMMVMISSNDLMVLYMGLELQSLPLYVVAAMRRDSVKSSEAGLKYFLLGALSSGLLLYGISLVYGFAGAIQYDAIARVLAEVETVPAGLVIGIVFMLAGIAFKISAAPFHMWTPDVYQGAPTIVTAFFAIAPKIAAMTLFVRICYEVFGAVPEVWQQITIALAVLSMVVGALGALMQSDLKRLLAYSSIAHMGYVLVALSAATPQGVSAVMLYLTIYVLASIGVFGVVLSLARDGVPVARISDLRGFAKDYPLRSAALLIFMFSHAGIPPLGGFFGKWFAFFAAVEAGLTPLAVIAVLASVVAAVYYLRIVKVMYIDEAQNPLDPAGDSPTTVLIGISAGAIVLFVFILSPLYATLTRVVLSLG